MVAVCSVTDCVSVPVARFARTFLHVATDVMMFFKAANRGDFIGLQPVLVAAHYDFVVLNEQRL
jgi:hypothetical protein